MLMDLRLIRFYFMVMGDGIWDDSTELSDSRCISLEIIV